MDVFVFISSIDMTEKLQAECMERRLTVRFFQSSIDLLVSLNEEIPKFIIFSTNQFTDYSLYCDFTDQLLQLVKPRQIMIVLSEATFQKEKHMKFALSQDVDIQLDSSDSSAVVETMMHAIYGNQQVLTNKGKVMLFIGTTPNIGTTVISFGTAVKLAMESEQQIGYMCLNLKSSKLHRYLGMEKPPVSLDHIRAVLRSKNLSGDRLKQYCDTRDKLPNLHILYGNLLREQAEYFMPEDIEHLLAAAKEAFDVCIVEVSAYWDNAATISGLLNADSKVMVTSGELIYFQEDFFRWSGALSSIIGVEIHSFDLVVNERSVGSYSIRDIRTETGLSVLSQLKRNEELTAILNQGKLFELFMGPETEFTNGIMRIAAIYMQIYHLRKKPQAERKKRWFKLPANPLGGLMR